MFSEENNQNFDNQFTKDTNQIQRISVYKVRERNVKLWFYKEKGSKASKVFFCRSLICKLLQDNMLFKKKEIWIECNNFGFETDISVKNSLSS